MKSMSIKVHNVINSWVTDGTISRNFGDLIFKKYIEVESLYSSNPSSSLIADLVSLIQNKLLETRIMPEKSLTPIEIVLLQIAKINAIQEKRQDLKEQQLTALFPSIIDLKILRCRNCQTSNALYDSNCAVCGAKLNP